MLEQAGSLSMDLCQRRLRWLGHVHRMNDGRIPKDVLYRELTTGHLSVGRPALRFKDICRRDLKLTDIDVDNWEVLADDLSRWRHATREGVKRGEEKRHQQMEDWRQCRKQRKQMQAFDLHSSFVCSTCGGDCQVPCKDWLTESLKTLFSTGSILTDPTQGPTNILRDRRMP